MICKSCYDLTGEQVEMSRRTDSIPSDGDTSDWIYDEMVCPRNPKEHNFIVEGSGEYETTL
jgi:hypothetical protein